MEKSRLDKIQDFLVSNGASIFAKLLYEIPEIYRQRDNFTMIIALSDNAIVKLEKATGKTIGELSKSGPGINILINHISILPTKITYPMFTSINGTKYGSSSKDLDNLRVKASGIIEGVPIIISSQVIIHGNQVAIASNVRNPGALGILDYQNFLNLINLGQLKGKDLVGLCLSNPQINDMCNQIDDKGENVFHKLVRQKGKEVPKGRTARDYYIELYTGYNLYRYIARDDSLIKHNATNVIQALLDWHSINYVNTDFELFVEDYDLETDPLGPQGVKIIKAVNSSNYNSLWALDDSGRVWFENEDENQNMEFEVVKGLSNITDLMNDGNFYYAIRSDGVLLFSSGSLFARSHQKDWLGVEWNEDEMGSVNSRSTPTSNFYYNRLLHEQYGYKFKTMASIYNKYLIFTLEAGSQTLVMVLYHDIVGSVFVYRINEPISAKDVIIGRSLYVYLYNGKIYLLDPSYIGIYNRFNWKLIEGLNIVELIYVPEIGDYENHPYEFPFLLLSKNGKLYKCMIDANNNNQVIEDPFPALKNLHVKNIKSRIDAGKEFLILAP